MRSDETAVSKFNRLCTDFPDIALLTKSATPREVQVTYTHASVENNPLRETVTTFALAGFLEAPTVVAINSQRSFTGSIENIHLPTTKVLLCAAVGDLSKS